MRVFNTVLDPSRPFQDFLTDHDIKDGPTVLVQVFSGILVPEKIDAALVMLSEALPSAVIIGATTTGEVADGRVLSNSITVMVSVFEAVTLTPLVLSEAQAKAPTSVLWEPLLGSDTKAIIAFSSGFLLDHGKIIGSIPQTERRVVIAGGIAGDNNHLKETFVFHGRQRLAVGAVAVSLSGPGLFVESRMKFNWVPIGTPLTITRCQNNVIEEIEGISVSALYRKYLGDPVAANLPGTASLFPLTQQKEDILTSRVMLAMTEDGAGVFTGSYAVGDKVRLAYADTDMLLDNGFTDAMHPDALEGLFVYSCGGRRAILGEATDQEIKPLEALATTGGFFTYGEFFTARSGSHEILNNTMTVLLLSESGPVLRQEPAPQTATTPTALQDNSFHFSVSDMYHSLSHFTREITQELFAFSAALERKNQELELLSVSDRLTGLYNRSKLDDVLAEELQRARRYGQTFSVILLDIDHFKSVNDTHGHQVGDDVLRALSQVLKDNCRLSDIVGRWGGEEFMVICPGTGLPGAKTLAETLRSRIAAHVCPIAGPRTASFGVTDYQEDAKLESIVERADKALYQAKEQGRNQVVAG